MWSVECGGQLELSYDRSERHQPLQRRNWGDMSSTRMMDYSMYLSISVLFLPAPPTLSPGFSTDKQNSKIGETLNIKHFQPANTLLIC